MLVPRQYLDPDRTSWHFTWGTHGTRLQASYRPTVKRSLRQAGSASVAPDDEQGPAIGQSFSFQPRLLTAEQQQFIESALLPACERGDLIYRIGAASSDHVHLLCDVDSEIDGEQTSQLLKQWLDEALTSHWPQQPEAAWWAAEGSNLQVREDRHLNNVFGYLSRQRVTRSE